jgi:hypothetical protein
MATKQSGGRGKSGNASGSRAKEARGGKKHPPGWSGGKHPKNKIFTTRESGRGSRAAGR